MRALILGMGACLAEAVPSVPDVSTSIWAQWGLAGLVVCYTLWRDYEREKRMSEALAKQNDFIQNTLVATIQKNSVSLDELKRRPCMFEKESDRGSN